MASVNPRAHLKWEIPAEVCELDLKNGERSRRRVRDLVTQLAFEGRSQNETERARISMMARSDLLHARAGYRSARPTTAILKIQLATRGRSIQLGQERRFGPASTTYGPPWETDILGAGLRVSNGPISDPRTINLLPQAFWFLSRDFLEACLAWPPFRLPLRGPHPLRAFEEGASSDPCALIFSSASNA